MIVPNWIFFLSHLVIVPPLAKQMPLDPNTSLMAGLGLTVIFGGIEHFPVTSRHFFPTLPILTLVFAGSIANQVYKGYKAASSLPSPAVAKAKIIVPIVLYVGSVVAQVASGQMPPTTLETMLLANQDHGYNFYHAVGHSLAILMIFLIDDIIKKSTDKASSSPTTGKDKTK